MTSPRQAAVTRSGPGLGGGLGEVGGVARVDPGGDGRPPIDIARISRSSYVAFELGPAGLRELPVDVAPDGETLRIRRRPSP